ncbi:uncharacterized protein LOC107612388 [Arachis ipaensis]|uniref:uncharacterized protein LOC107612388 n=1 Tax=Arachis ipaensis TaxID=130454 RepID=UPI0007AFAADC|nr:uncharacterized protein LOC107612388 [Arachis ipaensis]
MQGGGVINNAKRKGFRDSFGVFGGKIIGMSHLSVYKQFIHMKIIWENDIHWYLKAIKDGNRLFRFLAPSVLHEDYDNMVKESWKNQDDLLKNIASFIEKAKLWNRKVFDREYPDIAREVTTEEIKEAVFSTGSWKAPASDGLPAKFYQQAWDVVANSLLDWVKLIFNDPSNIARVNQTLIAIIPKIFFPENFGHFRPISLDNVCYKFVTQIITCRLKKFMPTLISNTQSSFVLGRINADNILVAQEVVHTVRNKRRGKELMAIKIDLEKSYDRLNWGFVIDTLSDTSIPEKIIRYYCSLLINSNHESVVEWITFKMLLSYKRNQTGRPPLTLSICSLY